MSSNQRNSHLVWLNQSVYAPVIDLADKMGLPVSAVGNQLIAFALQYVQIKPILHFGDVTHHKEEMQNGH